jgi:hypothetical protein
MAAASATCAPRGLNSRLKVLRGDMDGEILGVQMPLQRRRDLPVEVAQHQFKVLVSVWKRDSGLGRS